MKMLRSRQRGLTRLLIVSYLIGCATLRSQTTVNQDLLNIKDNPFIVFVEGEVSGPIRDISIYGFTDTGDQVMIPYKYSKMLVSKVHKTTRFIRRFNSEISEPGEKNDLYIDVIWTPKVMSFDEKVLKNKFFALSFNPAINAFQIDILSQSGLVDIDEMLLK